VLSGAAATLPDVDLEEAAVIPAQAGIHPGITTLTPLLPWSLVRAVIRTDYLIIVFAPPGLRSEARVMARCERSQRVRWKPGRLYGRLTVCGQKLWVHRHFYNEVDRDLLRL
jgi:hypothetical protein